jgi:integrase
MAQQVLSPWPWRVCERSLTPFSGQLAKNQDETLPFTRGQYDALIEATYFYDGRDNTNAGDTINSRRARAYLKLLRWSGLRAGDAACLSSDKLRDDDSLFLYQKKVKGKASSPVYCLLPPDVAEEVRNVPASPYTHPDYFFWSGRSKRKSEVSNWIKIFGKILAKATEKHPKLFKESDGQPKPAHFHMLRDTFAVEYLLAGMPLEEVSRLLGHSSVLITQKHYAPWVLERQQRLATSVRTAWSGRVVYIGYAKEPVSYETRLFVQKELDILGSRNAQPEDFNAVIKLLEVGKFPVEEAVSLIIGLDEAPEALHCWSKNRSGFEKIMVSMG